jgi:eukaryotic-like serine/threonine-protein kinase
MALTTRVWSAGKLLFLAGALVATYVLFAAASMRLALRASEVQVPDFTNRTASEATSAAAGLGLAVKVDETRRTDPKIAAGRILAQEPSPGATARRQRSVKVWISAGPRSTTVPGVTGESERTAQLRLTQSGFPLSTVSEIRSQDFPVDVVVAQEPPAKTPGSSVSLLVNRTDRGATYVMPDLIGVNGDRAAEALRQRGFRMAVVASNPYPGIPAGVVLRQTPQAGFQIAPGEPISLEVSR